MRHGVSFYSPAELVMIDVDENQFRLDELMKAYDTFGNAAKEKALKVLLNAG